MKRYLDGSLAAVADTSTVDTPPPGIVHRSIVNFVEQSVTNQAVETDHCLGKVLASESYP